MPCSACKKYQTAPPATTPRKVSAPRSLPAFPTRRSSDLLRNLPLREVSRRAEAEWWSRRDVREGGPDGGRGQAPPDGGGGADLTLPTTEGPDEIGRAHV